MSRLAFLILNYKNAEETIKCVNSIRNAEYKDTAIVIVDNGSKDGSAETFDKEFSSFKNIHFIFLDENLGFSKGNNLGYEYIRNSIKPNFLVVTNNDVLFPDKNMQSKIEHLYETTKFHVLGPDIYVRANNVHQSPMMLNLPSKQQLEEELRMYKWYLKNPKEWVKRRKIQNIKNHLCQSNHYINEIYNKLRHKQNISYASTHNDCCVQGACIIVSSDYMKLETKMFYPEPFIYCEELLLYKKCMDKGYRIVYTPEIQVFHEDSSTMTKINNGDLNKAKFTLPHHVKALEMVLDYWN